jgi:hypothetical protein
MPYSSKLFAAECLGNGRSDVAALALASEQAGIEKPVVRGVCAI